MPNEIFEYFATTDPQTGSTTYTFIKAISADSPPEVLITDDPCEVGERISKETADGTPLAIVEEWGGVLDDLSDRCKEFQQQPTKPPIPKPPKQPPSTDTTDKPPDSLDTPEQQGAQEVDVDAELSRARNTSPLGGGTAADLFTDPGKPTSPEEIQDYLLSEGYSEEEVTELIDRALKNMDAPDAPHPTHSREIARLPIPGGDPVDLFSGQLAITKVDIDVPTAVLPLQLVRTYRSGRPYYGPWGFGWDHNYNSYLRELRDGNVAHWTGSLHENLFHWTGDAFKPQRSVHERLEHAPGQSHSYLITLPGGLTFHFERPPDWTDAERIPLVEIRDRHGNIQTLTYDSQNRLKQVRDEDERALIFQYGTCGLLEGVEDHTGRHISYDHHPEIEHLVRVTTLPTTAYPDGASTCYEYDDRADHPAMRHNLLSVVDPEGMTYLQNEYGGPEEGWAFNRVVRQLYGDFPYRIEYKQIQYVPEDAAYVNYPALQVAVRPPDGSLHSYTFNYRGDLLDYRFRLNTDGSYRVVASQWEYDAQGNVTAEIRPDGGRTNFTYDADNPNPCAHGNLLKVELFAPPAYVATSRVVFQAIYDPLYQLPLEVLDERGSKKRFVYDFDVIPAPNVTGKLVRIELPDATLPDGSIQTSFAQFEPNGRNQTSASISPAGIRTETQFYGSGLARGLIEKQIVDSEAIAFTTTHEYDPHGFLRRLISPGNIITETVRDAMGLIEETILPAVNGQTVSLRDIFNHEGQLLRSERPRGNYSDEVLSGAYLLEERELDVLGNAVRITVGANTAGPRTSRFCFDHEGRTIEETDPTGLRKTRCYDERGLLLKEVVAAGTEFALARSFVYDRVGRLQQITHEDDRQTRFEYDPWGRIARTFLPNGSICHNTWAAGDLLVEVRVEGDPGDDGPPRVLERKSFEYDQRGRLRRETVYSFRNDPNTAVELTTEYHHDPDDRLVKIKEPRGGSIRYEYDGLDRVTELEDVHGNIQNMSYDTAGNLAQVTRHEIEPEGARTVVWQYSYDERSRLRSFTGTEDVVTELQYDDRDHVVQTVESLAIITKSRYGLLGEVIEQTRDAGSSNLIHRYGHDVKGRLTSYTDPTGEKTSWERDLLGRTTRTILPDGRTWELVYDPKGRLAREISPGGSETSYAYDPTSGRLVALGSTPGPGITAVPAHSFLYDGLDRVAEASVTGHTTKRRYDSLSRLIEEISHGKSVVYEYHDLTGKLDLTYPDGRKERTTLDLGGRPTQVSLLSPGSLPDLPGNSIAQFSYGGVGRLHEIHYGNGAETHFHYDNRLRLSRLEHRSGVNIFETQSYRYDARDRRRLTQVIGVSVVNRLHEFDGLDRLVGAKWGFSLPALSEAMTQSEHNSQIQSAEAAASAASVSEIYQLDDADSRTLLQRIESNTTSTKNYSYDAGHRLNSAGPETVSHYDDGPRSEDAEHLYDIDALGRIIRVRDKSTSTVLAEFEYDAFSRLVAGKEEGDPFLRWHTGGKWLHQESGGVPVRQQTPHPLWPLPLVERSAAEALVSHPDTTLSVVCRTNANGSLIERARFGTFGELTLMTPDEMTSIPLNQAATQPIFAAMPYLKPVKLYQSGRRLYHSEHGLYLSPDSLLYADSASPYGFVRHNPVDNIDPEGEAIFVVILVIAGIGALTGATFSAVRQGIKISEGGQEEFSLAEVGEGAATGAIVAPLVVLVPELAIPLAGWGVYNGIGEMRQGNVFTGLFDIGTAVLPFKSKSGRAAVWGKGTWIGQVRRQGSAATWGERVNNFYHLEITARLFAQDLGRRWRGQPQRWQLDPKQQFRDWVIAALKSRRNHSLRSLIDPGTGGLLKSSNAKHFDPGGLFDEPSLDAMHLVSDWFRQRTGGEHWLALGDSFINRGIDGKWIENPRTGVGGYIEDMALTIDMVPLERRTALFYGGEGGIIPPSALAGARPSRGWTPKPWHRNFTLDHPGLAPLPFVLSSPRVLNFPWPPDKK